MNKRTVSIMNRLCETDKPATIAGLAEQFEVSQRTIRNDLNSINQVLAENHIEELALGQGGLVICADNFNCVKEYIAKKDYYAYKLSQEERVRIASAMLVSSAEHITLSVIADNLFVSRATIINDLDDIKEFIRTGNMQVLSHPNKGLRVEGKESHKRLFLMNLKEQEFHVIQNKDGTNRQMGFQAGDRIMVQKIVEEQEQSYHCYLTDNSFQKILMYLGILINRNLQGEYIEPQKPMDNSKYQFAQSILKYVAQYCQICTSEDEVQFLSEILLMSRYMKQGYVKKDAIRTQMITRQFITCVSEELGINLNSDYDFFENLSNHLESVFLPEPPDYPENQLFDEILSENQEIFQAVSNHLPVIGQYVSRMITRAEIGYIAIHVCAAIERRKNREIAFHVVLACHAGIGTSQLLMERLKKHFNFQIVDIVSSHEAKNIRADQADFIISTVPLKDCKLEYVVVTPLLSDEDYIRVGNKIHALRDSRKLSSRIDPQEISAKGMLEQIQPVVQASISNQEEAANLIKELRKVIRYYFNQSAEAEGEIFSPYLHHMLPESHIQLDVECEDWRDAVRKSAIPLLNAGYIEEKYIQAMIANIEENGPYCILVPGFAVPHEGLEKGSIRVGMNLIRLQTPIKFGIGDDIEEEPVQFVCCLSPVDHKTHLKAFFNLVNMLQKQEFLQALQEASNSKEASEIIEKYEYAAEGM